MPHTLGQIFQELRTTLFPVSQDLADRDTEQIIGHVLHLSRTELFTNPTRSIKTSQYVKIKHLTSKRLTGLPLPYVLGYTFFYGKTFTVNSDVLIPRPDTEVLVETILAQETSDNCRFIDLGIGPGTIAETLVSIHTNWRAFGIDISPAALRVAHQNCSDRVCLVCSDKFTCLKDMHNRFDFIVSNPPYISEKELKELEPGVRDYEPIQSLFGGSDGLDFYRYLACNAKSLLKQDGRIYCEIGATQSGQAHKIFSDQGWHAIMVYPDLANRPRVIRAKV